MSGEVTEVPGRKFAKNKKADGTFVYTGLRTFDVVFDTGTTGDENDAAALLKSVKGVDYDVGHPQTELAVCNDLSFDELVHGKFYRIVAGYASSNPSAQQLLEPPTVKWDPYEYITMSDVDADGIPNVNTAGFPFDRQIPLEKNGIILTFTRWEQYYDVQKAVMFGGKRNSDPMGLFRYTATPGQVKCRGIFQGEYSFIADLVKVSYVFDIREEGHTHNVADLSAKGWTSTGGGNRISGNFVYGTRSTPAGSIRLNGQGFPLKDGFKVQTMQKSVPTDPYQPPFDSPTQAIIDENLSSEELKVLGFKKAKAIEMSGLAISL